MPSKGHDPALSFNMTEGALVIYNDGATRHTHAIPDGRTMTIERQESYWVATTDEEPAQYGVAFGYPSTRLIGVYHWGDNAKLFFDDGSTARVWAHRGRNLYAVNHVEFNNGDVDFGE